MKPILYSPDETAFDSNGIGILSDAIDCTVIEVKNNQYEAELIYPVGGIHFLSIQQRSIIMAKPNPVSDPQPFRVYQITKPMNRQVTIYARHIAYDLAGITVTPFTATGVASAFSALKSSAVTDCPFTFWTDMESDKTLTVKKPQNIWTVIGSSTGCALNVFGGEYEFDRYLVRLWNRRGADRGVSIRYGKNLTDLQQDENCANCYTAVHPYWIDSRDNLVQLTDKIVKVPGNHGYTKIMPLDLSRQWKEAPTEDQLLEATEKYIADNHIGVPEVSWKVQFVQLEQTEEYKGKALLERVLLGDTVSVEFAELGVSASARVTETRYKPILERYESVTLGTVKPDISSTIAAQNKQLANTPNQSQMELAISSMTAVILGAYGGAVRFLDTDGDGVQDTLYIADNADPALAVKVWRFNYQGWGASKNGYNGPFVLGATLEDGFIADFITAGTLNANLVKVINLIADHVKSVSGDSTLEITGAYLKLFASAYESFALYNFDGVPIMYMSDYVDGKKTDGSELSPHHLKIGGTSTEPTFYVYASDGKAKMRLNAESKSKSLAWKDNGDGTYTLIGS